MTGWARTASAGLIGAMIASGCYASHEGSPPPVARDAGRPPPVDAFVPPVDALVPPRDAFVRLPDGGPPPCDLEVLDRAVIEWPSIDCGAPTDPQVVPVGRGPERFALVVGEQRFCDDRPGAVYARGVGLRGGDRLEPVEPVTLGLHLGPRLFAAASGRTLAACSGRTLFTHGGVDPPVALELVEDPGSVPGCPQSVACAGVAADGAGWTIGWDRFECDVSFGQLGRWTTAGAPRDMLRDAPGRVADVARGWGGALVASSPRGATAVVLDWPSDADDWIEQALRFDPRFERSPTAVTPWILGDGSVGVVAVVEDALSLVVFDRAGAPVAARQLPLPAAPGFGPVAVAAWAAPFGVFVAITDAWQGGAIRSATRTYLFDADGDPIGPALESTHELFGPSLVDVASDGDVALVHRALDERHTEALLLGCR